MANTVAPDKLLRVTIHGANIASTLYAVTTGGAPCDGLLFGDTVTTTTQHLRDDDDMATVTESRAAISSTLCCAGTCSFYDEAGELDEPRLEELARQQPGPLLGWMSFRPAAPAARTTTSSSSSPSAALLRPSMREAAVTAALLRRQLARQGGGGRQQAAVLLLLVTCGSDHNGATITWQYRCFQARCAPSTGQLLLDPLPVHTLNLGGHSGAAAYGELASATALAAPSSSSSSSTAASTTTTFTGVTAPTGGGAGGTFPYSSSTTTVVNGSSGGSPTAGATHGAFSPANEMGAGAGAATGNLAPPPPSAAAAAAAAAAPLPAWADPAALGSLAAGARSQVTAVRGHCEALLGGLQELCGQAVAGEAAVAALRARRDALLGQLAAARGR